MANMALSYKVNLTPVACFHCLKYFLSFVILLGFLPVFAQCPFYLAGIAIGATFLVPQEKTRLLFRRTRTNSPHCGTKSWRTAVLLLAL